MLLLRAPAPDDREAIRDAYQRSAALHGPWTSAPADYDAYVVQDGRYLLCRQEDGALVGTFHISGVVRGNFQSAYLGYEAFEPHQGCGYMTAGIRLLIKEAFDELNLHRLEANIQPGNEASIRLVARAGFVKEGFSRQYLRVNGQEWRDHERWALLNDRWAPERAAP